MSHAIITHNSQLTVMSNLMLAATNRFLIEVRRDKSLSTYKTYSAKIKIFIAFINSFPMSTDARADLKAFRSHLRATYSNASTINLCLSVVRTFYKSLLERGVIDTDPTVVMKNVKESKALKKSALSKDQIHSILAYLSNDTSINAQRNRTLFILLAMNGLRVSEAANLEITDFGLENGKRVAYLKRKGYEDKSNFVVLQDKTYDVIMDLVGTRTEGAVFVSYRSKSAMTGGELSRIIKTIYRRCGIDSSKITAHSLRHSFSIMALTGGASLMALSRSLNHANVSTTQRYLTSYDRLQNAAEDCVNLNF